jgi:hypothetical protein
MKQHAASGELHLSGVGKAERGEVLRVLRNEEERAREKNRWGESCEWRPTVSTGKSRPLRKSWCSG